MSNAHICYIFQAIVTRQAYCYNERIEQSSLQKNIFKFHNENTMSGNRK